MEVEAHRCKTTNLGIYVVNELNRQKKAVNKTDVLISSFHMVAWSPLCHVAVSFLFRLTKFFGF